jgi:hypothetical protein
MPKTINDANYCMARKRSWRLERSRIKNGHGRQGKHEKTFIKIQIKYDTINANDLLKVRQTYVSHFSDMSR